MNLVDCYVTEILTIHLPKENYKNPYWVDVEYTSYGVVDKTTLFFKTLEEVKEIKKGYKFQA